jgi:hypothetical protein
MVLGAYGCYPTLDDLAKLSLLFERHRAWRGRPLLKRSLVDRLLPSETVAPQALPASADGSHFSLDNWHLRRISPRSGCTAYLPRWRAGAATR